MTEVLNAVAAAGEDYLISISNKGIYKRACKDIETESFEAEKTETGFEVKTGGETVKITVPLEKSTCSCVSRSVCRHIIGAILLIQKNEKVSVSEESMPVPAAVPEEKPKEIKKSVNEDISENDILKINQCAGDALRLISEIVSCGLTRLPEDSCEKFEIAAVRCHSLKMADAERQLRELGRRLGEFISRKSTFDIDIFTSKLLICAQLLEKLKRPDLNPDILGTFKKSYEEVTEELTILPVGMREITGGDYEGSVYYFLDITEGHENKFLSFSDIRPVFYETAVKRNNYAVLPWNLSFPLNKMMKKKLVLKNAKLSEGRLSSSKDTAVVMTTQAQLNCEEVWNLIITDFRQIAEELVNRSQENELERLFFILPEKCTESRFDVISQKYIMTFEDKYGSVISAEVKYSSKVKSFISQLEVIGEKMLKLSQRKVVLLAIASIDDGKIKLFPVEFYDFITPLLKSEYTFTADADNGEYAAVILELIKNIREKLSLTLQCGLSSGIVHDQKLCSLTSELKMKGLALLLDDFYKSASMYRHSLDDTSEEIILKMMALEKYISLADYRLKLSVALHNMI